MANNNEYNDYSDAYAARSENTNTSVKKSKRNRYVLDNNMNWYIFENNVKLGIDFFNKYKNTIYKYAKYININKDYFMRPEYVSYTLYGTTDLWHILLWLNNMKNPNEFVKQQILVIDPKYIGEFQRILDEGRRHVHNSFNPVYIRKHYLKHPDLKSDNLLSDAYNDKIYDNGVVSYDSKELINNLQYIHNFNDYYHGKTKMNEIEIDKFTEETRELSFRYMDGIQISNNTYEPILDTTNNEKEYKFSGYMYFPYDGTYEFQFNGINGNAYLIVDGEYCTNSKNEKIIQLPKIDKKFDFFELKTKNSDFKKRNWSGWTYHNPRTRLVTDVDKKKPVAKTIIDENFFKEPDENSTVDDIVAEHIFYNKMNAADLNINLEPLNDGKDDSILFRCEMKAFNVSNVQIQPYLIINYADSTSSKTILNDSSIGSLWSKNEYEVIIVTANIDSTKNISSVEFGILCEKSILDTASAEIFINEVSINYLEFNETISCEIKGKKNSWLPFTCSYKYDGNELKMFYVKRKINIKEELNENITGEFYDNFKLVDNSLVAIVPSIAEKSLPESVLVTISNDNDKEACYLQHNINKNIKISSGRKSIVSYKTCLIIEDNDLEYKLELDSAQNVDIYLDDMAEPIAKGTNQKRFTFIPKHNPDNDKEIEINGYRVANFEIYIKDIESDNVSAVLYVGRNGSYEKVTDDYFIVDPLKLFKYEECDVEVDFVCDSLGNPLYSTDNELCINTEECGLYTLESEEIMVNRYKLYQNKKDVILIDDGIVNCQCLNVFKPGIITISENTVNRDCNNYVLEFDLLIDSDQNGQFIINLDEQPDGSKYSMILNYKTMMSNYPIFNVANGLYTNTLNNITNLNNIDKGIDFYKHRFEEIPLYKSVVDVSSSYAIKKFIINKNKEYKFKIKKKKNFVSLKIDDQYVAIWHDYEKAYTNGFCGFTFANLNNVRITNLHLYC